MVAELTFVLSQADALKPLADIHHLAISIGRSIIVHLGHGVEGSMLVPIEMSPLCDVEILSVVCGPGGGSQLFRPQGGGMLELLGVLGRRSRRCPKTIASFRETSARCCSSILDGMSLGS